MDMLFEQIKQKPFFILGPCVIENQELLYTVAEKVAELQQTYDITVIFKSSFDKANRTSVHSYRGPGLQAGLEMLQKVKDKFELPLLTDIHESHQAATAAEVVDILQIPAFLCRQTDLLAAAANTGKIVNIKKAQFLSGNDMYYPAQKVLESGNNQIILTERGNTFGYNNLAVDFRNLADMKAFGYPVCMDCTHSVQRPGGAGGKTGGDHKFVPMMAHAAKAFGADGYFMEVHPDPDHALSDGPNMLKLQDLEEVIQSLIDK
jgi:2-dehydro-3-deoxyphosphooctonate aldolase (KDO 8-P synthase)